MLRALELAVAGRGRVEPNPMVGCVIVDANQRIVGVGHHEEFGGPHAEVMALRAAASAGYDVRGATMYVTLEPCCHHGKTPPCAEAVVEAGIGRVIIAMRDPFPKVDGGGVRRLTEAGIEVRIGLFEEEARAVNAPYLMLLEHARPWVIAKWAMTLDGKIATHTGSSRWITNQQSRRVVHELRARVDGVLVGSRTALVDDPMLDARLEDGGGNTIQPARAATRIVAAGRMLPSVTSRLVQTARDIPVLIFATSGFDKSHADELVDAGCELFRLHSVEGDYVGQSFAMLKELGRRHMTNLLVEGGAGLLGSLFDARLVDEVHTFIAPKVTGGTDAPSPVGGQGVSDMMHSLKIKPIETRLLDGDMYLSGRVVR